MYFTLVSITIKYAALIFYYASVAKKYDFYLILTLVLFYVSSVFFTYNPASIYGILILILCRILLIKMVLSYLKIKNINWRYFVYVFLLLVVIAMLISSLYYNGSVFFYLSLVVSSLLIIILTLSFLGVLNSTKKGALEFFIAIFLFVVSDMIFGAKRVTGINTSFIILASLFYNIAYYLITKSVLKRDADI